MDRGLFFYDLSMASCCKWRGSNGNDESWCPCHLAAVPCRIGGGRTAPDRDAHHRITAPEGASYAFDRPLNGFVQMCAALKHDDRAHFLDRLK